MYCSQSISLGGIRISNAIFSAVAAPPALLWPRAVYGTIAAVEHFVEQHYEAQIRRLDAQPELHALRETLLDCQGDEVAHRDEAAVARGVVPGGLHRGSWCRDTQVSYLATFVRGADTSQRR